MALPADRSLLDALDEPAMVVEGKLVTLANRAARTLLGTAIVNQDVRLAIRHPQALEKILSGSVGDIDIISFGEFGRPWTLAIRAIGPGALLIRFMDRSAAAAAEKMRVDFVANASHELRTPLATIFGYAETLTDEADLVPERCAEIGKIIGTHAQNMLRIIEDLMGLSRIEAGRFVAPTEAIAIGEVARAAVDKARSLRGAEQCDVRLEIENGLPIIVGDHGQLMQLFDNLLSNAVRYGCLSEACRVLVTLGTEDGWVRISVIDTGPGIPREHLPRLTARFYRVDPARSRDSGGTGLGLAIVKHIVERHKGTLEIRSTVGEGTEVVVRLPDRR